MFQPTEARKGWTEWFVFLAVSGVLAFGAWSETVHHDLVPELVKNAHVMLLSGFNSIDSQWAAATFLVTAFFAFLVQNCHRTKRVGRFRVLFLTSFIAWGTFIYGFDYQKAAERENAITILACATLAQAMALLILLVGTDEESVEGLIRSAKAAFILIALISGLWSLAKIS